MLALKIIFTLFGTAFALFGYLIFFRKKYSLINGFEADLKAGRKNEDYARRVGITEFVLGIGILIAAAALIVFD